MKLNILFNKCVIIIGVTMCLVISLRQDTYAIHKEPRQRHSAISAFFGWSDFTKRWKDFADNDTQLIAFKIVKEDNEERYLGAWRTGGGSGALYIFKNWPDFVTKWKELNNQRLIGFDFSEHGGWYTGIWHKGEKVALFIGTTAGRHSPINGKN